MYDDFRPQLVWNKGIAALCDRRIPDEFPDGDYTPVSTLAGALMSSRLPDNMIADPQAHFSIRDGELVWVRLSWLKSFVRQVLPHVKSRFVLVTADSDSCVPSELMTEARAIISSPVVTRWYTQNYDGTVVSDKLSPLPIGIDFHTLCQADAWGELKASSSDQERKLITLRDDLPPADQRIPKVYIDFAWQKSWGLRSYRRFHPLRGTDFRPSRRRIATQLRGNDLTVAQQEFLPRNTMWRTRGDYAFVLSPHGVGLDCHRTWEALALGHIVLVPSSSLDPLFAGLPVIPFKSLDEISGENLARWLKNFRGWRGNNERLTSRFWVEKMRAAADMACSPRAT